MPVVHVYTTEGWVSPKRKKLMVEKITDAVVEAEGREEVRKLTYVLVHDVPEGGWGWQGKVIGRKDFEPLIPPDPD
jgi:4-oxalocrotonate tautomerase